MLRLNSHKPRDGEIDHWLLWVIISMSIVGLVFVYNASSVGAQERFGDSFHYLKSQLFAWVLGLSGMYIAYKIPIDKYEKLNKFIYWGVIVLLVLTFLNSRIYGASRWIFFQGLSLQPSELSKLALILQLAFIASNQTKEWLKKYATAAGIILSLVLFQPDLDTTVVLATIALGIYFVSGAPIKVLAKIVGAGIVFLIVLIVGTSYRSQRLLTFFNINEGKGEESYHIWQVILALGSGGLLGHGLGMSRFKYGYIPEAVGDSIFAIIGEELGFAGAVALILAYLWLVIRIFRIARQSENLFYSYIAVGVGCWIGAQAFINISAMVVLIPLTGITLPLISYGGTSLLSTLIAFGWVLQISKYTSKSK